VADKVIFDENPLLADFGAGDFAHFGFFSEGLPVHFEEKSSGFEV